MVSRMDKYQLNSDKKIQSRSQKNEHLYEQLYENKVFTEFTDIANDNVVNLSAPLENNNATRRERFQKNRMLNLDTDTTEFSPKLDNIVTDPVVNLEDKNYNINDVLETAKKNRTIDDESKQKRYLKTVEYSILSDLAKEKLKETQDKKQSLSKEEEENLEELIHTITSNSLRKKIDDELLSDLLPSEDSETVISKQLLEQLDDIKNTAKDLTTSEVKEEIEDDQIDRSFYTKSMDLSEEDFEQDEDKSFIESSNGSVVGKVVLVIFIILILGLIGYILYRFI